MQGDFVEELRWRGLLSDMIPETQEHLQTGKRSGYIGFDPTADALHVGSLVPVILLRHFQNFGHRPIVVVGGATGMIGDPSGKSKERNLLDEATLAKNAAAIKAQLMKFLNFDEGIDNAAVLVNNYDWMKEWSMIDFSREIGKHITINYMTNKESVKKRMNPQHESEGMSFTEFTYQLFQGYDFLHLYKEMGCTLQMGGNDQWGNITTGTELIRRKAQGKAYALTTSLVTKSDGSKFGKSEQGNVWLDKCYTSVYKFYQFWLNASDEDAEMYIKKFTFLPKATIEKLVAEHHAAPHTRVLQKKLAKEITVWVHGEADFEKALQASRILFGKRTASDLKFLDEATFLDVFDGVPMAEIPKQRIEDGLDIVSAFSETGFLSSNAEVRRSIKGNALSVNKNKITNQDFKIGTESLIANRYVLLQRGKKNYFLLKIVGD